MTKWDEKILYPVFDDFRSLLVFLFSRIHRQLLEKIDGTFLLRLCLILDLKILPVFYSIHTYVYF